MLLQGQGQFFSRGSRTYIGRAGLRYLLMKRVLVLEYRVPVLIANVSTTYQGHIFPPISDD